MVTSSPGLGPAPSMGTGHQPANLADILERVLDRGLVIAGDIQVNLLDIELLTLKLRLVIASVDTARQLGIDWWETDPWLSSSGRRAVGHGDSPRGEVGRGDAGAGELGTARRPAVEAGGDRRAERAAEHGRRPADNDSGSRPRIRRRDAWDER